MPNPSEKPSRLERRVRQSWRAQACAAGLCVGTQVFLLGTGAAMPLALNSAWIASLTVLPCAVLIAALCRRAHLQKRKNDRFSRALHALLAATLFLNAVFAAAALIEFAQQTLLPQASAVSIIALAVPALLLCAASGGVGVSRTSFLLRYAMPVLLLALTLASMPQQAPAGLFPLLGAGPLPLGAAALCMTAAVSPALMLLVYPMEIAETGEAAMRCEIPGTRFFLWRVLSGAGTGILLLFAASVCMTYEAIGESGTWGARLHMISSGQPHEGLAQMTLTVLQLAAMGLLAANMLAASAQALACAFGRKRRAGLPLLALGLGALLVVLAANGFGRALFAAPLLAASAAVLLIFHRRLGTAP